MSHRPYIKDDSSGNISDLAIDAETLQGYKPCVNIVTLEDNGSTTAGTWLAKTNKVSALVDGQLFLYKITVAGASTTTLNITGSAGTALGAKTVYRVGTTKLTTQYPIGHYILLAYNSLNTCFRVVNDYDANSDTYVRQYQHGKNAAGTANLYPILTRYNLTNKSGTYDNAYARFYTDTYVDITNGYLYAPKVYSGGSEVAVKTDIPTKSSWNYDDRYVRFDTWDQDLTELQKIQARVNIGAGTSSFSGSYNDLTDKPDECIKTVPMYIEDGDDDRYIFLWGLKEDTHTLYFLPEGTYYVYARGTNLSDRDGYVGTFFGPGILTIHSMGSSELRYNLYDGYGQGIGYGSVHRYPSTIDSDYYEYSPIVKAKENAQTGTIHAPLYIKYTSPTYTDGATYEFAECSLYAGGTNVTLNGTSKSATTASFYAPTTAGTSGQVLKSAGVNASPAWSDPTYVDYSASQSLTDAQKSQARSNIGAGTSSLAIGTTASTAAAGNHTHSTTLATDSGTATVTMVPNKTYKLSTGGTNVIFKTPSDAYKIAETLRKGSEADTAVGYYKIATINHDYYNFCDFCMLVKNSYAGTLYSTIFNCSCTDSAANLRQFKLNIISGTDISSKLAYLYTYDSDDNLIKIEVFIHATKYEHPICYIINARPGTQLVIPTQDEFDKATPDQADGTTMTGYATYAPVSVGTSGQLLSSNGSSLVWTNDNRGLLHHDLTKTIENTTTDNGWSMFNDTYDGFLLKSLRFQSQSPAWGVGDYGSGIIFGGVDTKGVISLSWRLAQIKFAGGNSGNGGPVWWIGLTGTSAKSYDLDEIATKQKKKVTGSWTVSTSNPGPMVDIILDHPDIKIYYKTYASSTRRTDISSVLFHASHDAKQSIYMLSLRYLDASGSLTTIGSGTIYYEYFE